MTDEAAHAPQGPLDEGSSAEKPDREELEQFLAEQTAAFNASQRDYKFVVPTLVALLVVPCILLIPGAERSTGMGFGSTLAATAAVAFAVATTTTVYRIVGDHSRVYQVFDTIETIAMQAGIGIVVGLSGRGDNFFWFFYLVHVVAIASRPLLRWYHAAQLGIAPLVAGAWLWVVRGASMDVALVFAAGCMGALLLGHGSGLQRQIETLTFGRRQLMKELAEVKLRAERTRIARDLHDGVTADLTAIAWRADLLAREGAASLPAELTAIGERARAAIDDARSVVWGLSEEQTTWEALAVQLESKCAALCEGRAQLEIEVDRKSTAPLTGPLATDLMRMVQRAVRDALERAKPSVLRVSVRAGADIEIDVQDDGAATKAGSSAGMQKLEARVADRGGSLSVDSLSPGTRIGIRVPFGTPDADETSTVD